MLIEPAALCPRIVFLSFLFVAGNLQTPQQGSMLQPVILNWYYTLVPTTQHYILLNLTLQATEIHCFPLTVECYLFHILLDCSCMIAPPSYTSSTPPPPHSHIPLAFLGCNCKMYMVKFTALMNDVIEYNTVTTCTLPSTY